MSTENYHHVQLKIENGELTPGFTCTAPEDAPCRRRPKNHEGRQEWSDHEATEPGFACWAIDWIAATSIGDAIMGFPDRILASVPVEISYEEAVFIEPVATNDAKEEN